MVGKGIWCGLFDLLLLFFIIKVQLIFDLPYEVLMKRELVWNLAKNDFKVRYVGSYLGIFWAFINPLVTILLYWIVFQFAFHSGDVEGYPFVLWLVSGLVPWFLIQDAVMNGTSALLEYAYLVKKVVFQVSVLPSVKVISACFVHVVFMAVVMLIFICMGYFPGIYWIQLLYYFLCAIAFTLAITYATSAIVLFVRDLGQFISVFMQVFMWATPIMWDIRIVPVSFQWIFKLNPAYYIVTGYRDALLYHISIFQHMGHTLYFWSVVIVLLIMGSSIFRKLQPHFADVL
ncbi:MAG: ABC transporter permease [Lachnospiraceae bacterium]|nr:ABC transporter permease [Lachnospiraceae bacterium]